MRMSIQNTFPSYQSLTVALNQQSVALTAAEMHGLISGLLCGGSRDAGWQALVHDLTNEGVAFPQALSQPLQQLYEATRDKLAQVKDEVGEAIDDLRNIAQLGYDEDEDQEELEQSLEEVAEYVRVAAIMCHGEFTRHKPTAPENIKPTLH